jgi:hypothetical protein
MTKNILLTRLNLLRKIDAIIDDWDGFKINGSSFINAMPGRSYKDVLEIYSIAGQCKLTRHHIRLNEDKTEN